MADETYAARRVVGDPIDLRFAHRIRKQHVCPDCNYIGDPRLCNCVWRLGYAIEAGDLEEAAKIHARLVEVGNAWARASQ